jgi:hypothetical protein
MDAQAEPGWAPWDIRTQSRQLLLKKDFKGLDALAATVIAKGFDIRQDDPEIVAFYQGFQVSDKKSEKEWQDRLQLLKEWVAADSNSVSAHIALANWYINYGWKVRGYGYAYKVTDQGWTTFKSSASSAAESVGAIPSEIHIDDPSYYDTLITICMMQGCDMNESPKEKMFGYLNQSIALAKEYEPIYLNARLFLMERWYGDHEEAEKWMKTWADSFPSEKGDLLYAFLFYSDSQFLGKDIFKLDVDYKRAKEALEKRISENDPEWVHDENVLCYLAMTKQEKPLTKKMLYDLYGMLDYDFYSTDKDEGEKFCRNLCDYYGINKGFKTEMELERSGKLGRAERLLKSFTFRQKTYLPLAYFYERQGMRDSLNEMDYMIAGKPLKEMAAVDISSAPAEYLAELAGYYPMMGEWDKAEEVARQFDKLRPMNLIGKNILLLCAIQRHDSAAQQAVFKEILNIKYDVPIYSLVMPILSGSESWQESSGKLLKHKNNPYLAQAITPIVLHDLMQGKNEEARAKIEVSLPVCADNSGKTLLQSLLFGSLSYLTKPPAPTPTPATASPTPSSAAPAPSLTPIPLPSPSVTPTPASLSTSAPEALPTKDTRLEAKLSGSVWSWEIDSGIVGELKLMPEGKATYTSKKNHKQKTWTWNWKLAGQSQLELVSNEDKSATFELNTTFTEFSGTDQRGSFVSGHLISTQVAH